MPKKDITVIQLRTATRERLKEIGKKGESYDAIINRILDDRNISGARSSHDGSREYPLPLHPEVVMNSKKMVEEFVEFLSDEQKEKFARIICDTPSEYLEVIIGDMGGFEGIAAWGLW